MVTSYLWGYAAFIGGIVLHLLSKIADYRKTAKSNPNPDFKFSMKDFWADEWLNLVRMLVAGIALVIFLPMLVGEGTIDMKTSTGTIYATFAIKKALIPAYFFIAYSGNSAVFAIFGRYKKTFLNQLGVEDEPKKD